jgi:hypothetical protein
VTEHPETPAIFVVGPSRSGTSMMRAILNGHSSVALAGETHYFDDLRVKLGDAARRPLDPDQRERCEDYFLRLSHRPYGHGGDPAQATIDRAELRARAAALGGTGDAHFEAYCRMVAERDGASIWGDKTPRHIFRIGEILGAYPAAKVVAMVRDPRSVVLSYRDWKNQGGFDFERDPEHLETVRRDNERARRSYNPLVLSLLWRSQLQAAVSAADRFGPGRVRIVRYEDVVGDFERTIGGLAGWLGLPYEASMADVPMLNSSFNRFEPTAGVSSQSLERWRTALDRDEIGLIQSACGRLAARHGYEPEPVRARATVLAAQWATLPVSAARAVLVNRDRTGRVVPYVARRVQMAIRTR